MFVENIDEAARDWVVDFICHYSYVLNADKKMKSIMRSNVGVILWIREV